MELLSDCVVVDVAADQNQLILAIAGPVGVIERKSITRQMEHMAVFAFLEPAKPRKRRRNSGRDQVWEEDFDWLMD